MKYSSATFRLFEHIGKVADSFLEEAEGKNAFQVTRIKRRRTAATYGAAGITVTAGIAVYFILRAKSPMKSV